ELLGNYGQGGNCGYGRRFLYHNSFLIADQQSAWVLETAGEYWAAARVHDFKAISNSLSLGSDFDRAHPRLVEHAISKGWCRSSQDFHFARCYTNPLITRFSGAHERCACNQDWLTQAQGKIDAAVLMTALRSHHPQDQAGALRGSSVRSVCMHGGGLIGDHTTGSYVADLSKTTCTYWVTGSSTPCLSTFKPLWLDMAAELMPEENNFAEALEFWYQREVLNRAILQGQLPEVDKYLQKRDALENNWLQNASHLTLSDLKPRQELMAQAWREEAALVDSTLGTISSQPKRPGSFLYRSYWQRQTQKLTHERQHPHIF
ncbi:MAG: hypothetical protein ACM3O9_07865, partial [Methylocystaceae bacterium]